MNRHIIIGNLTRDPEGGVTLQGLIYTTFTVAVNRRRVKPGEPEADFIRVTAWAAKAESCRKYLRKGSRVAVIGESSAHGWTGQDGTPRAQIELTAVDVEFLGGTRGGGEAEPAGEVSQVLEASVAAAAAASTAAGPESGLAAVDPEDLPF